MPKWQAIKLLISKWWQLTVVIAILSGIGAITLIPGPRKAVFPGGWEIGAGESRSTRQEKDSQGNLLREVEVITPHGGKTAWDWLGLLGVPISLAILGYFLQQLQQKQAAALAKEQREQAAAAAAEQREQARALAEAQRQQAADEEKEEILQLYFDRLSTLVVDKNILLIAAKPEGERTSCPTCLLILNTTERNLVECQFLRLTLIAHLGVLQVCHPPQCSLVKNETTGRNHPVLAVYQNPPANIAVV